MKVKRSHDHLARPITFNFPPQRIISLVPSQTELLFDLGMGHRVVGITKFCVHPREWHLTLPKVGGTKKFDFDVIEDLRPDLIIGNKEENYEEGITQLSRSYPVWMSDINAWEQALRMITDVGDLTGETEKARLLTEKIQIKFREMKILPPQRTLYFIWRKPWMVVGKNTFIDGMLSKIGLTNDCCTERYPELSWDEIAARSPELVLLSSEPFPFTQKHADELQQVLPGTKILLVDGEMFSWYGSRLVEAPDYFSSLFPRIVS